MPTLSLLLTIQMYPVHGRHHRSHKHWHWHTMCFLRPHLWQVSYHGITMFTPTPSTKRSSKQWHPAPLIQALATAQTTFIQEHDDTDRFDATPYDIHCNTFMMWCLAFGQKSIPKCHFSILTDNDDLNCHKTNPSNKWQLYQQMPSTW